MDGRAKRGGCGRSPVVEVVEEAEKLARRTLVVEHGGTRLLARAPALRPGHNANRDPMSSLQGVDCCIDHVGQVARYSSRTT